MNLIPGTSAEDNKILHGHQLILQRRMTKCMQPIQQYLRSFNQQQQIINLSRIHITH